jgi:hypothetical protein
VHSSGLFAYADGEYRAHPRLPGAAQHRFTIVRVAWAVQVGVGIDQQWEPPGERIGESPREFTANNTRML